MWDLPAPACPWTWCTEGPRWPRTARPGSTLVWLHVTIIIVVIMIININIHSIIIIIIISSSSSSILPLALRSPSSYTHV